MRYIPGVYQGVPNQREFRAAATGRPLQWDRSDQPAALAAYLNAQFKQPENGPSEDGKRWQRVKLGIHGLNRWPVKC